MTPETTRLLAKAQENVKIAELLLREGYPEVAASRAYYAMFYVAEALLWEQGQLTYSSHGAVLGAYGREFAKTSRLPVRFHRALLEAQELRHAGDYHTEVGVTEAEVQQALQNAQEFLAAAIAYLASSPT